MKNQQTADAAMPPINPAAVGNYNRSMGFIMSEKQ
jgi:hypothetical protein